MCRRRDTLLKKTSEPLSSFPSLTPPPPPSSSLSLVKREKQEKQAVNYCSFPRKHRHQHPSRRLVAFVTSCSYWNQRKILAARSLLWLRGVAEVVVCNSQSLLSRSRASVRVRTRNSSGERREDVFRELARSTIGCPVSCALLKGRFIWPVCRYNARLKVCRSFCCRVKREAAIIHQKLRGISARITSRTPLSR